MVTVQPSRRSNCAAGFPCFERPIITAFNRRSRPHIYGVTKAPRGAGNEAVSSCGREARINRVKTINILLWVDGSNNTSVEI